MARPPKYGVATKPLPFRPRPSSEEAINTLVKKTGITRAEIADEAVALGLPDLFKKHGLKVPAKLEQATTG